MMTSSVLMLPDHEKPFTLIMDASDYATGAILEQKDALGRSHPITYFSKSLQPAERNYKIHNKELLAIIHALKHFRHYIQGNPHMTTILSDHANLKYFTTKQTLTCQQARWALFLSKYNYTIVATPGKQNTADALSQHLDHKEGIAPDNTDHILLTLDKF
jgi:RNase H-like domain found in reverse transcriptase